VRDGGGGRQEEAGGGRRRQEERTGVHKQKQEPHTKM